MTIAVALIALALGYQIFANASKEKEGLKALGQVLGIIVMVGAVVSAACCVMKCAGGMGCPMMSKRSCPTMSSYMCPVKSMDGSGSQSSGN